MLTFLALCLLSRIAYTFNDMLVGQLAREHDGVEISTFRGNTPASTGATRWR
jgi:hypothetical protein